MPGVYVFYCAVPGHEASGMHGRLIVIPKRTTKVADATPTEIVTPESRVEAIGVHAN